MEFEKATYSKSAILECRDAGKAFKWNTEHKADHNMEKLNALKALYDLCYEKTGCILFRPDNEYHFEEYRKAVCDYPHETKKDLDKKLRLCGNYISWELRGIAELMVSGEVNSVD